MGSLCAYHAVVRPAKSHFFGLCYCDEKIAFPDRSFLCNSIYYPGILPVLTFIIVIGGLGTVWRALREYHSFAEMCKLYQY